MKFVIYGYQSFLVRELRSVVILGVAAVIFWSGGVWAQSSRVWVEPSKGGVGEGRGRRANFIKDRYRDLEVEKRCGRICRGRFYRMSPAQVNSVLEYLHRKFDYKFRIRAISSMFLGAPYKLGPLGEGEGGRFDRDPLFRLDRFDCVTYVETVLALARSKNLKEAVSLMQKIRYLNGKISYFTRNHFTAGQWIPNNIRAGFLAPLMDSWPDELKVEIDRKFSLKYWFSTPWGKRIPPKYLPSKVTISYVRLRDIGKVVSYLPKIGWMGEIRTGEGPVVIQHVGFFLKKFGRFYFRDANYYPGVSDHRLLEYAKWRERRKPTARRPYRIIGFTFFKFTDLKKERDY